jgi:hypothetical protein
MSSIANTLAVGWTVARGLSGLQRWILVEAGKREKAPRDGVPGKDNILLYYCDILAGYFGWEPASDILAKPSGRHFSPTEIGVKQYRRTMAALSRSCRRLKDRGLVVWRNGESSSGGSRWAAVELTDEGRKWLSVNQ